MLKTLLAPLLIAATLISTAQAAPPVRELKVGFVPGPYIDEFKVGVQPELEKKGYKIRYYEFSTGLEANSAVFKGDIDANVMQHSVFLASYNERNKTDLVGLVGADLDVMRRDARAQRGERPTVLTSLRDDPCATPVVAFLREHLPSPATV